jgi:hypothetical protein
MTEDPPDALIGPVMLLSGPNGGRGLGSARALGLGELLLIAPHLAFVDGQDPDIQKASEDDSEEGEIDMIDIKFAALQKKLLSKKYDHSVLHYHYQLTTSPPFVMIISKYMQTP